MMSNRHRSRLLSFDVALALVALLGWRQQPLANGQQQDESSHLRRLKAQVISILDVNQPLNSNDPATTVTAAGDAESTESSISLTDFVDQSTHVNVDNQQPAVALTSAEVISDETSSVLSTSHDPVLSTLAEKRPCGIVPAAVVKTVVPTWLASYPESGSQEMWRLVQAVTGLMTDEDVTNHGHAMAGKAVIVKTHFPSHTPADIFENFQSKLLIQKAVLLVRNPIYAIPALHKFLYAEETKTDLAELKHVPVEHWIQWRNANFELELTRWMDQIRWWVFHYQHVRFDKLLLIPYERLVAASTGVDQLWKLAFFLRSVDRSIVDSMIPLDNFQCLWQFVVGPLSKHEEEAAAAGAHPGPFTSRQLELIRKALEIVRDEYMTSYHELASVAQFYLIEVDRLIASIAEATR